MKKTETRKLLIAVRGPVPPLYFCNTLSRYRRHGSCGACRIRSGPKKFAPQFSSCHWCCSRSLSKRFCNAHATPARHAPSCDATSRSQSPSPSPSSAFSSPACFRPFPFCRGPLAFPTLCWRFYSRVRTTFRLQLMWGWRRH